MKRKFYSLLLTIEKLIMYDSLTIKNEEPSQYVEMALHSIVIIDLGSIY